MNIATGSLTWLPEQMADGIARLTSTHNPAAQHSTSEASVLTIEAAIAGTASVSAIKPRPLSSKMDNLAQCIISSTPMVIQLCGTQEAVIVLRATSHRATLLATDGKSHRVPLRDLMTRIELPLPDHIENSIEGLREKFGSDFRFADAFRREFKRHRSVFAGWTIPTDSPDRAGVSWSKKTTVRALGLVGVHIVHFGLWILSWLALVSVLLGIGERSSLLTLWVIALSTSLLALPVESLLQQDLVMRLGVVIKQALLNNALGTDKMSVRKLGIGQLIARALETNRLDGLATKGGIRVLLIAFDTLLIIVLFSSYAGFHPLLFLFLLTIAMSFMYWRAYYRTEKHLHSAHLAVTALHTEEMIGHRTRKAFLHRPTWHSQEDSRLADYGRALATADNAALRIGVIPRLWAAAGITMVLIVLFLDSAPTLTSVALIGFVIIGYGILQNASRGVVQLLAALVSFRYVTAIEKNKKAEDPGLSNTLLNADAGSNFTIKGLRFSYPDSSTPVIRDVNFTMPAYQKVVLSGTSGSGKSTIGALLAGRLTPDAGAVLSHGVDRSVVGEMGWLQHVCYVPQSGSNHVLTDSFAFNLLLGRTWPPTREDLKEAYDVAVSLGLGPLLENMPAGITQMVGEGGWRLSQGECARLFVARGILQGARVLIVDELLSPLDPSSGLEVLQALEELPAQVILIAHT